MQSMEAFRAQLRGTLLTPDDDAYDEARNADCQTAFTRAFRRAEASLMLVHRAMARESR